MVWCSRLFQNFPQFIVIHIVKAFGIVNKAEIDVFLELCCFFHDPAKVRLVKAMVFPVVMRGCESWTVKKAERPRTDAFELWCWRRLLRVPWTARRSNQSILKEVGPECTLEGLLLQWKLQYFGYLMRRSDSFEKTLMLGKTEGLRRRGQERMRWLVSPTPRT